jgi:hypothetical protein
VAVWRRLGAGAGLLVLLAAGAILIGGTLAVALTRAVGDQPAEERDADEAADVTLVRCRETQGRMSARLRVTNRSSQPSDYYVDVTFVRGDAAATPVETATAVVEDLAPGRTEAVAVGTAARAPRTFDCEVGDVDRLAG